MTRLAAFLLLLCCGSTPAQEPGWISLIERTDPKQAVAGRWTRTADGLLAAPVQGARIALGTPPASDYDFRVSFTRRGGSGSVALLFVAGGSQASFDIDGWGQHLSGIQQIGGRDMRAYAGEVKRIALRNGERRTALVQVRKTDVSVFLDSQLVHRYRAGGVELSLLDLWRMPDGNVLGVAAWDSETVFHRVEVRPAAASAAAAPSRKAVGEPVADDLARLSDEFDDATTLRNWRQVHQIEQTGADQLERLDIGRSRSGWITLVPYTSSWYQDWRGAMLFKQVQGDFVVTTHVHTTGGDGRRPPARQFSLAGIMVRTPRAVTPQTWRPGGENYLFLSHGAARTPGAYEFEVKTTLNSISALEISPANAPEALIRVLRVGAHFVLLRKPVGEGPWIVHRRYHRPDMPAELQVGMTVYTDWQNVERIAPQQHNGMVVRDGQPDLVAAFNYMRFRRPAIPERLRGRAFSDATQVSDAEILSLLGS